jgi:hypothetical protein
MLKMNVSSLDVAQVVADAGKTEEAALGYELLLGLLNGEPQAAHRERKSGRIEITDPVILRQA